MKISKKRADELVFLQGLVDSRSKAQALIMASEVLYQAESRSSGEKQWLAVEKSGQAFVSTTVFKLKNEGPQDVGRGALKLRGAFEVWPELENFSKGALALDVGSSTGGFTQVLLEKGAARVVALDVGTHQLHERLRGDSRVLSLEQTHVLKVEEKNWASWGVTLPFQFVVMDVSFISVTRILPHVALWMAPNAPWIVLIKPQFELDRTRVPKGIVRKEEDRQEAIRRVKNVCEETKLFEWKGLVPSPIQGGDGNIEYLAYIERREG